MSKVELCIHNGQRLAACDARSAGWTQAAHSGDQFDEAVARDTPVLAAISALALDGRQYWAAACLRLLAVD